MNPDTFANAVNHVLLARVACGLVVRDWLGRMFIEGQQVDRPLRVSVAMLDQARLLTWRRVPRCHAAQAELTRDGAKALGFFDLQVEDRPLPAWRWAE